MGSPNGAPASPGAPCGDPYQEGVSLILAKMQDEHSGLVILATVAGHFAAAGEEMQAVSALSELLLGVPPYPLPSQIAR